jgi:hypothetical protein
MVKWVVIGRSAGPWLTVGKVNGGAPSNKVALVDRVSVGERCCLWRSLHSPT